MESSVVETHAGFRPHPLFSKQRQLTWPALLSKEATKGDETFFACNRYTKIPESNRSSTLTWCSPIRAFASAEDEGADPQALYSRAPSHFE